MDEGIFPFFSGKEICTCGGKGVKRKMHSAIWVKPIESTLKDIMRRGGLTRLPVCGEVHQRCKRQRRHQLMLSLCRDKEEEEEGGGLRSTQTSSPCLHLPDLTRPSKKLVSVKRDTMATSLR